MLLFSPKFSSNSLSSDTNYGNIEYLAIYNEIDVMTVGKIILLFRLLIASWEIFQLQIRTCFSLFALFLFYSNDWK